MDTEPRSVRTIYSLMTKIENKKIIFNFQLLTKNIIGTHIRVATHSLEISCL